MSNNEEERHLVQREKMRSRASWESPDSRGIDMNLSQLITCDGDNQEHGIICILCIMHYLQNMHLLILKLTLYWVSAYALGIYA